MRRAVCGLALFLLPLAALAHELTTQYGPFWGPALHVFTEIDHLAAFAVVGMFAGQHERMGALVNALVAFTATLTIAMALPFLSKSIDIFGAIERELSASSTVVIGVLVAAAVQLPIVIAACGAAALGGVHGLANGLAIANSPSPVVSLLGAVGAAMLVAAAAAALVRALHRIGKHGTTVVRVMASWIAALALMLLGLALRG